MTLNLKDLSYVEQEYQFGFTNLYLEQLENYGLPYCVAQQLYQYKIYTVKDLWQAMGDGTLVKIPWFGIKRRQYVANALTRMHNWIVESVAAGDISPADARLSISSSTNNVTFIKQHSGFIYGSICS